MQKENTIKILTNVLFAVVMFLSINLKAQKTEVVYLSGTDFENPVTWEFFCTEGMNSGKWSTIGVPSQWELQGFGEYTYGRWYKEGGLDKPSTEEGLYRYRFQVPSEFKGMDIDIVFGGAMTDTEVKINGKIAGPIHQGGFYQFSYPISNLLKYGSENLLEVHVWKHSSNKSVNAAERKADWWLFGGIYRPVWLDVKPKTNINNFAVDPKADGSMSTVIHFDELKAVSQVELTIIPLVGTEKFASISFDIAKGTTQKTVQAKWEGVKTWSPEDPNLYVLTIKLKQNGIDIHEVSKRIGFRTLEFKKRDGIYVNGVRTIFKGINRHTHWPESGRSTSKRISLMDAQIIKDMNMNAVRTHYPPDPHFLDMCDSLGLFFMDELAGWQNPYDDAVGSKLVKEMIVRDVNHPSVVIWSNGNEGGWNYKTDKLFAQHDPQNRIVVHPWADFDGWDTHHYPAYQTGIHRFNNGENVFLPTEFAHGMYDQGHGAGLEDFWNKFMESPLFAGGFMWEYADGAVKRSDWTGEKKYDSYNYMAPDGIVGPYREKEGSVFTVKEIWAPIQFRERKITPSFDGTFLIRNDYLYTNLNTCTMKYRLIEVVPQIGTTTPQKVLSEGSIIVPDVQPGETRKISIGMPENFFEADVLEITAWDKQGREIYTWTWPIHLAGYYAAKFLPETSAITKATATDADSMITLRTGEMQVVFNKTNGYIVSIQNGKESVPFNNGPRPLGMKARVTGTRIAEIGNDIRLTVKYTGGIDSITWLLTADGLLNMNMVALNNGSNDGGFDGSFIENNITAFGLTFDYPEANVKGMEWFGRGPYRVWKNRIKGTGYGIWDKDYNNTITGESFENLVYPEFKGYHANLYWANVRTTGSTMSFVSESDELFLRMLTPDEPAGRDRGRRTMPAFPSGDISFLYEIPAIWCFKPLEHHGPKSQPASIRIKLGDEGITMKLWFDFRSQK